jgi:hypothetical protein
MISRPDQRVLAALSSLEGNTDFEVVMAWIRESREDLVGAGMYAKDEVLTRWSQGAYQALDVFINQAESARKNLRK